MTTNIDFKEQVRRNAVALISLAVAVTSLGYNTWRNEASEHNRNQRLVSIELLLILGDFQQLVLDRHYGVDNDGDAILRGGWSKVLTVRDLGQIAAGSVPSSAMHLFDVWSADYDELGDSKDAKNRILMAVDAVRIDTKQVLESLD